MKKYRVKWYEESLHEIVVEAKNEIHAEVLASQAWTEGQTDNNEEFKDLGVVEAGWINTEEMKND